MRMAGWLKGKPMAKERILWIDIAKGVAMAAVVLGHTFNGGIPAHTFVYSFHVPLFFMLAGCTFRVKPMREVLGSSAKRLLVPYLILALLTGIYDFAMGWLRPDTLLQFLGGVIFASGDPDLPFGVFPIGMPWFLMALFIGRLLYNAVFGFLERRNVHPIVQFLIFAAIGCAAKIAAPYVRLPLGLMQGLLVMFYMHIGHCACRYDWVRKAPAFATVICLAIWAIGLYFQLFFWEGNPLAVIGGLATVVAASWCVVQACRFVEAHMRRFGDCIAFFGANSLIVFELHVVESFFITWPAISFNSLGALSPVAVGVLHLALIIALLWLFTINPIKKPERQSS